MTTPTLPLDGERLLQIARDTGLRHHLHGVDPTAAGELLSRFAAAVISAHTPTMLDAIDGAMAYGALTIYQPPTGHWLQRFWDTGHVGASLLAEIEREYIDLADYSNNWPGRNTPAGQMKLGQLRALIAKATRRNEREVQDDYGTRAAREREALTVPTNDGHGHVFPRPDGLLAKCGGPNICPRCAADVIRKGKS